MSLLVGEFKNIVELTADCLPKLRLGPTSHVSSSTLRSFDSFETNTKSQYARWKASNIYLP
jgi:hypothetical protein